jgi:SAM-dependent methyltransferase
MKKILKKFEFTVLFYRSMKQFHQIWINTQNQIKNEKIQVKILKDREKFIDDYLIKNSVRKLQIGSGTNQLAGWLNTDIEPATSETIFLDATLPMPFPDQSFNYVFCEHMIEHLHYQDGLSMLSEIYRVMKPNGRVRVSTPNMLNIIGLFSEQKTLEQRQYIRWSSCDLLGLYSESKSHLQIHKKEWDIDFHHFNDNYPDIENDSVSFIVNNFFRSYGHLFLYDPQTLTKLLSSVGFNSVTRMKPGQSNDPMLQNLELHGNLIGTAINEFETMVFEACKQ